MASLQELHCCISNIYFKKNVLKEKAGKQAPHNSDFFMVLQHLSNAWEIIAGKQLQEVWTRLPWRAVGVGRFPTCFATTSPWPFAFLTCFATAAPWPFAWGLFLGLLPSMLVHKFQRIVSLRDWEHMKLNVSILACLNALQTGRRQAAQSRLCANLQLLPPPPNTEQHQEGNRGGTHHVTHSPGPRPVSAAFPTAALRREPSPARPGRILPSAWGDSYPALPRLHSPVRADRHGRSHPRAGWRDTPRRRTQLRVRAGQARSAPYPCRALPAPAQGGAGGGDRLSAA